MAKILGWIGSAITFLSSIAFAIRLAILFGLVGYWLWGQTFDSMLFSPFWIPLHSIGSALIFLSLYGLGNYYNDDNIKRDSLRWFICWTIFGTLANGIIIFSFRSPSDVSLVVLVSVIISFITAILFLVISTVYLKDAYTELAAKTGVDLFNIAAKLYVWGSLLLAFSWAYLPIAAFVGALIVLISWVVSSLTFLSIKPNTTAP